jgi:hypothetical protein
MGLKEAKLQEEIPNLTLDKNVVLYLALEKELPYLTLGLIFFPNMTFSSILLHCSIIYIFHGPNYSSQRQKKESRPSIPSTRRK